MRHLFKPIYSLSSGLFLAFLLNSTSVFAQSEDPTADPAHPSGCVIENSAMEDNTAVDDNTDILQETGEIAAKDQIPETQVPDHIIRIAPYPPDKEIQVQLVTDKGPVSCNLYAGTHPLTVLNFIALANGKPAWADAEGHEHHTPYYDNLPFESRVKNAYAVSGLRPEGTNFYIPDERCKSHQPTAGSILMLQQYPGTASAQFLILARDISEFKGMYTVFGHCEPIDTIKKLTQAKAVLLRINTPNQ